MVFKKLCILVVWTKLASALEGLILSKHEPQISNVQPWHLGTHMRALSESFSMNTVMIGFEWFSNFFASLFFGHSHSGVPLESIFYHFHTFEKNLVLKHIQQISDEDL